MYTDTFTDALDGTATLEATDNMFGEHVIINIITDAHGAVGIALSADQAAQLAYTLQTLAAGV